MDNNTISRAEHDEFVRRMDEANHRQDERLEALEKTVEQIHALTVAVEKLAQSVSSMAKAQEEHGKRLETIEERDGEMWRKVVSYGVTAIVGGVVAYILSHIGL